MQYPQEVRPRPEPNWSGNSLGELRGEQPQQSSTYPAVPLNREPFGNPMYAKDNPPYVFPGMVPFVERAANYMGCDLRQSGLAKQVKPISQIQSALGQLPSLDRASQLECLRHALLERMILAAALEGADMAIMEVVAALGLPVPGCLESRVPIPPTPPVDESIEVFEESKPKAPKSMKG